MTMGVPQNDAPQQLFQIRQEERDSMGYHKGMAAVAQLIVVGFLIYLVLFLKGQIEVQLEQKRQYQDRGQAEQTLRILVQKKDGLERQIEMLSSEKVLSIVKKDGSVDISEFAAAFGYPRSTIAELRRRVTTTSAEWDRRPGDTEDREQFFNDMASTFNWSATDPSGMFGSYVVNQVVLCEDPREVSSRLKGLLPRVAEELGRALKEEFTCFDVPAERVRKLEELQKALSATPGGGSRRQVSCQDPGYLSVEGLMTMDSADRLDLLVSKAIVDEPLCKMTLRDLADVTAAPPGSSARDKQLGAAVYDRLKGRFQGGELTVSCNDSLFGDIERLPFTPYAYLIQQRFRVCSIDLDGLTGLIGGIRPHSNPEGFKRWLGGTLEELRAKGSEQIDGRRREIEKIEPEIAKTQAALDELNRALRDIDGEFLLGVLRSISLSLVCLVAVSLSYNMAKHHTFELGLFNREFLRRRRVQLLHGLSPEFGRSRALESLMRSRLLGPSETASRGDSRQHLRVLKQMLVELTKRVERGKGS
jgi:cell division protein FtsB